MRSKDVAHLCDRRFVRTAGDADEHRSADLKDIAPDTEVRFNLSWAQGWRDKEYTVSEIWLDAEVRINRADFGLTWNWLGAVSATSTLTVHAVFIRP